MKMLMDKLKAQEDKLNLELENAHGEYAKTKAVLQKRIGLYLRYSKEEEITELERLTLTNKREWNMAHLLLLITHEESLNTFSELTKRIHNLEQKVARLEEHSP